MVSRSLKSVLPLVLFNSSPLIVGALVSLEISQSWGRQLQVISVERQEQLRHLLKHDCGSCHGMSMKGGLGPSLTQERIHDFPTEFLVNTILQGRPGTAMPPWQPFLTKAEANWLALRLKEGGLQ